MSTDFNVQTTFGKLQRGTPFLAKKEVYSLGDSGEPEETPSRNFLKIHKKRAITGTVVVFFTNDDKVMARKEENSSY